MSSLKLRTDGVAWKVLSGQAVLVDLRTGTYLSTNTTATLLWEFLAEGTTRDILVETLVQAYAITPEQAGADVDRFLDDCRQNDLLVDDQSARRVTSE